MLGCSAPHTGPLQHAISIVVPSHYLHLDKRFAEESASKSAGATLLGLSIPHILLDGFVNHWSLTQPHVQPRLWVSAAQCWALQEMFLKASALSSDNFRLCAAVFRMGLRPPSDCNPVRTAQDTPLFAAVSMNWSDEDNT